MLKVTLFKSNKKEANIIFKQFSEIVTNEKDTANDQNVKNAGQVTISQFLPLQIQKTVKLHNIPHFFLSPTVFEILMERFIK